MNIFFKLIILVFLNGISAMLSQIILFREILSQVYANELVLGFMLSFWLLAGAFAGTYFYEKFIKNLSLKKIYYSIIFLPVITAAVVLLIILFIRSIKIITGIPPEVIINIWDTIFITAIVFFPVNFILTLNFSLIIEFLKRQDLSAHSALFYLFEALGAIFIGVIYTIFLSGNTTDFVLIYWLGIINIAVIYIIFHSDGETDKKIQLILTFVLIFYLLPLITNFIYKLDRKSADFNFSKHNIIFNKELKTTRVTITRTNNIYNVYSNGILHYSKPDEKNKEFAGWAILTHPKNSKILLLNGGYTGMIEELLKYNSPEKIFYIENDNEEAKILKKFFEEDIKKEIERVNFYYGDAIYFLKNNIIKEKFDTVVLNTGFQGTLLSSRYYTQEFFKILKNYLNDDGVLIFSLPAGENYIDRNMLYKLSSIYKTVKSVFENVFLIHGESLYFLCSKNKLEITPGYILQRIKEEKADNPVFNKRYLEKILNKERQINIESLLERKDIKINTIYSPVACFYGILSDIFYFKNNFNIIKIILIIIFFIILFIFIIKPQEFKEKKNFYLSMFIISFTGTILQMLSIFLFQSLYGYIYQLIGLLFAVFMAGIVGGCLFAYLKKINLKIFVIFILILSIGLLLIMEHINPLLILFYLFCTGLFIGASYTIILSNTNASFLYGVDLMGGAAGAFLVSIFLVPVIGIKTTIILCIMTNFILLFMRAGKNAE